MNVRIIDSYFSNVGEMTVAEKVIDCLETARGSQRPSKGVIETLQRWELIPDGEPYWDEFSEQQDWTESSWVELLWSLDLPLDELEGWVSRAGALLEGLDERFDCVLELPLPAEHDNNQLRAALRATDPYPFGPRPWQIKDGLLRVTLPCAHFAEIFEVVKTILR